MTFLYEKKRERERDTGILIFVVNGPSMARENVLFFRVSRKHAVSRNLSCSRSVGMYVHLFLIELNFIL